MEYTRRRHPTQVFRLKTNLPFVNTHTHTQRRMARGAKPVGQMQLTAQDMNKQHEELLQILTLVAFMRIYFSALWVRASPLL